MIFRKSYGSIIRDFFDTRVSDDEALILYLKYSGVLIKALDRIIAFDIANLLGRDGINEVRRLDLLIYTHSHYDHFEYKDCIDLFERTNAYIVAEKSIIRELVRKIPPDKLIDALPGEVKEQREFKIHFIEGRHVGPIILYIIEYNGLKIFHGGDSAYVPLKGFRADIAFVPVGKPSPTASPMDAFKMIVDLKPKVAIPIHGTEREARELENIVKKRYPDINIVLLKEYSLFKTRFK